MNTTVQVIEMILLLKRTNSNISTGYAVIPLNILFVYIEHYGTSVLDDFVAKNN